MTNEANNYDRHSHRNVQRSLCIILTCVAPAVNSFCIPEQRNGALSIRISNRLPTQYFSGSFPSPISPGSTGISTPNKLISHQRNTRNIPSLLVTKTDSSLSVKNKARMTKQTNPNYKGKFYDRIFMMKHKLLTREEEIDLGNKVVRALQLRDKISSVLEDAGIFVADNGILTQNWEDLEFTSTSWNVKENDSDFLSFYDDMMIRDVFISEDMRTLVPSGDARELNALVRNGSKLRFSSVIADLNALSENGLESRIGAEGGQRNVLEILREGAEARDTLMTSNIRLVVSIARKWMDRSLAANGDTAQMQSKYDGAWDRPSLDEAIQEGILGLARAVDKFDPKRGLKFSTYSTYWITNYVRGCFQEASTGCLKIPHKFHDIKIAYNRIQKRYKDSQKAMPSEEDVAQEIGVSVMRLRFALRTTRQLKSMDEPIGLNSGLKGSGAGGDNSGDGGLTLLNLVKCEEIAPEDFVERSFLRQTLENAMAAELSPHERDVLRLRLGLDDGQTRTAKQVVEEYGGSISVADVRSAEKRAVKKLSSPHALYTHKLFDYIDMTSI